MKKNILKFSLAIIVITILILVGFRLIQADTLSKASIDITSDQSSYAVDNTIIVAVKVNPGSDTLGAVEANLEFDPSILQYVSLNESADFDETLETKTPPETPNAIHLVRGKLGGLTSKATIYSVNFKALKSGNSTIISPLSVLIDSHGSTIPATANSLSLTIGTQSPITLPTVTLTANDQPNLSIQTGNNFNLKWSSTGATSCISSWAGDKSTQGQESIKPNASGSYTYNLVCIGQSRSSGSAQVSVTVTDPPAPKPTPTPTSKLKTSPTPTKPTTPKPVITSPTTIASSIETPTPMPTPATAAFETVTAETTPVSTKVKSSTIQAIIDTTKSIVSFDKTSAASNGSDKICEQISIKDQNGTIMTAIKPIIKVVGGVDLSPLTLSGDNWNICMTSIAAGDKKVTTSVYNTILSQKIVSFTGPAPSKVLNSELSQVTGNIILPPQANNTITDNDFIEIQGVGTPGTTLRILIHSSTQIERNVTVGADGKWSLKLDQKLAIGQHKIQVIVMDKYGHQSLAKTIATFAIVKSQSPIWLYLVPIIIVLILIALLIFLIKKRRKQTETILIS